ncbi:hypothetical protein Hdeb2414_s0013g00407761 [Helianthus debilis subsp. tardiflorus]
MLERPLRHWNWLHEVSSIHHQPGRFKSNFRDVVNSFHRRSVRSFTTCYSFKPPFRILCDETFIHHVIVNRVTLVETIISNILGAPVKILTTRFYMKSVMDCLADVIGESNSEHFFVATQDIPVVPAIFALRDALFLKSQQQIAKATEEGHSRLNKLQIKMLNHKKKRSSETSEQADEAFPNETIEDLTKVASTS